MSNATSRSLDHPSLGERVNPRPPLVEWGRWFGYDFFISYKRGDAVEGGASDYALALAQELRAADFRVFLDSAEAPIGLELKPTLTKALAKSRALILIATREAIASKYVQLEVQLFASKGRRPVIPINVGDAFSMADAAAPGFGALRAREPIWINIDAATLASGRPAADTLDRIRQHAHFVKSNVRLRIATCLIILLLAALATYAAIEALRARREEANALLRQREAQVAQVAEGEARKVAEQKTGEAEASLAKEKLALEQETKALEQAELRRREAERQRGIAVAGELAARAQSLVAQRGTLLPIAGLLAVEALRRQPSLESDRAARDALMLLPRRQQIMDCAREGELRSGQFNADGGVLATQSRDAPIRLWDTRTARSLGQVPMPQASKFVLSPDGTRILTIDDTGAALVWKVADATAPVSLSERGFRDVAFSADGDYLASVHSNSHTRLWSTDSWKQVHEGWRNSEPMTKVAVHPQATEVASSNNDVAEVMRAPGVAPTAVRSNTQVTYIYSPDGKHLAQLGRLDYFASLFEVQSRRQLIYEFAKVDVSFSADGSTIAMVSPEWNATSYNLPSCTVVGTRMVPAGGGTLRSVDVAGAVSCHRQQTVRHDNSIWKVTLSRDGRLMGTVSADGTARVWETYRGREVLRIVEAAEMPIKELSFVGEGGSIAAWGPKGCRVWASEGHRQDMALLNRDAVIGAVFSPDDTTIATVDLHGLVRLWDAKSGAVLASLDLDGYRGSWRQNRSAPPLLFRTDGASLTIDARLVWNPRTGVRDKPPIAGGPVLAFAQDWSMAVVKETDKVVILHASNGREMARHTFASPVIAATLAPNGCCVAVAEKSGDMSVWQLRNWRPMASAKLGQAIEDVRFDRQGRRVLARSKRSLVIFDAATGRHLARIDSDADIKAADFDPSGRYVAVGDADRNAWLYDTEQQQRIASLRHDAEVVSVAFSHDGRRVLSGGDRSDRTARVWLWQTDDLVKELCSRLGRDLTRSEWAQYLPGEPYRSTCSPNRLVKAPS